MAYFPTWYIVWVFIGAIFLFMMAFSIYKAQIRYKNRISVHYPTQRAAPTVQVNTTNVSNAPLPPPLSNPAYPPTYPPAYPPPPTYNQALNQPQYPPPSAPRQPSQMNRGQPTIEYSAGAFH